MKIKGIIWFPKTIDKLIWKHNVDKYEVEEVLLGKSKYRKIKKGHIPGEDLYAGLGQTKAGRYLIVFFYLQDDS